MNATLYYVMGKADEVALTIRNGQIPEVVFLYGKTFRYTGVTLPGPGMVFMQCTCVTLDVQPRIPHQNDPQ